MNKGEFFLARIPVSIAVGAGVGIKQLTLNQLEEIITGKATNWKAFGGPDVEIQALGREPTEALFTVLKSKYSFFESAKFSKVLKKDNQIINYLKTEVGKYAIGFGAKPNFEKVDGIQILPVKDFTAGVSVGLVYDLSNQGHPLIPAVKEYVNSKDWADVITGAGFFPPSS